MRKPRGFLALPGGPLALPGGPLALPGGPLAPAAAPGGPLALPGGLRFLYDRRMIRESVDTARLEGKGVDTARHGGFSATAFGPPNAPGMFRVTRVWETLRLRNGPSRNRDRPNT